MKRPLPVRFRWTEHNREKIARHNLSTSEVEYAWKYRFSDESFRHPCGLYFESFAPCPSGRIIKIVWRWNRPTTVQVVYVITAFGNWKR